MNQTSSKPGASLLPETTDLFTGAHLALIALLAVLVVIGIVAGMRRAAKRRAATTEVAAHNRIVEAQPAADAPRPRGSDSPTELLLPDREPLPEPVGRVAPPEAPAPEIAAPPLAAAPGGPSAADGPVTQLKGLGPRLATRLGELGITTVGQLAALTDDEAQALDAQLGPFTGRLARDRWQEQARFLAAGDRKGFEAVFGRL